MWHPGKETAALKDPLLPPLCFCKPKASPGREPGSSGKVHGRTAQPPELCLLVLPRGAIRKGQEEPWGDTFWPCQQSELLHFWLQWFRSCWGWPSPQDAPHPLPSEWQQLRARGAESAGAETKCLSPAPRLLLVLLHEQRGTKPSWDHLETPPCSPDLGQSGAAGSRKAVQTFIGVFMSSD